MSSSLRYAFGEILVLVIGILFLCQSFRGRIPGASGPPSAIVGPLISHYRSNFIISNSY